MKNKLLKVALLILDSLFARQGIICLTSIIINNFITPLYFISMTISFIAFVFMSIIYLKEKYKNLLSNNYAILFLVLSLLSILLSIIDIKNLISTIKYDPNFFVISYIPISLIILIISIYKLNKSCKIVKSKNMLILDNSSYISMFAFGSFLIGLINIKTIINNPLDYILVLLIFLIISSFIIFECRSQKITIILSISLIMIIVLAELIIDIQSIHVYKAFLLADFAISIRLFYIFVIIKLILSNILAFKNK